MVKSNIKFIAICFVSFVIMTIGISNVNAYTGTVGAKYCGDNFKFYIGDTGFFKSYVYTDIEEVDSNFSIQWVTDFSTGTSNRKAYCIEKGKKINKAKSTYSLADNGNVDDGDYINANMARAIAYGQDYDSSEYNKCSNPRVATSTLVQMINANKEKNGVDYWRTVKQSVVKAAIQDGTDGDAISNYFIKIRDKVLEHKTKPSLNALDGNNSVYATYKTYTSLSDAESNPITYIPYVPSSKNFQEKFDLGLSGDWDWTISKVSGASYIDNASISDNVLSVTLNTSFPGNKSCIRIGKKVRTGKLYKTSLSTQDTAVLYDGGTDVNYYYACFKEDYVKVTKQDASTKALLNDFQFRLFDTQAKCEDSSRVDDDTTNAMGTHGKNFTTHKTGGDYSQGNGTTYFYHVKENSTNTYWVREMYPPSGYQISGAVCRQVKVNDSTGVVFEDDEISNSSIKVSKLNKYDGTPIYNVKIGLYSDSACSTYATGYGIDASTKTTGASGTVYWNIDTTGHQDEILKFYVKEISTPSGYIKDTSNSCQLVTVKASNSTSTQTIDNTAIIYNEPYGDIKLLKQNSATKNAVSGISFTLLDENKNPAKDKDGKVVETLTTDSNGYITFKNIKYGKYYLQEKNEDTSYKEITDPISFTLNKNTDAIILKNNVSEKYKIGDINNDAAITVDDSNELTKIIGDITLLGDSVIKRYASDIDGNGIVDSTDKKLLDKYLGVSNYSSLYSTFNSKYNALCKAVGTSNDCKLSYSLIYGTYNIYLDNKVTTSTEENTNTTSNENSTTTTDTTTETEEVVTYKLGDVNKNGKIDSEDVTLIAKCIGSSSCSEDVMKLGDVNKNGQIDANDRTSVENYLIYEGKESIYTAMKAYLEARNTICDNNCDFNDKELELVTNIGTNGIIPKEVMQSSLVVFNEPINMKISKQDITSQAEIPGATIVIKNEAGKEILKFTSTEDPKEFNISAGKYTLVETVAPKGYNDVTTTIVFEVLRDGDVKVLEAEKDMAKVIVSDIEYDVDTDHLIVYNVSLKEKIIKKKDKKVVIPNTASNIAFLSIVIGGSLILGGGYVLYKRYKVS